MDQPAPANPPRRARRRLQRQGLMLTPPNVEIIGKANHLVMTTILKDFVREVRGNENLIFSPYATIANLSLLRSAAKEHTSIQLCRASKIPATLSKAKVNDGHKKIITGFDDVLPIVLAPRGSIGPFFRWFNKLYVPLRFQPLHEDFVRLANDSYGMQVEYVDLKQQNELDRINREFAQNTEGKVNTVFNQGEFVNFGRLGLVMMNSTYFSCLWESHNGFDPAKTKEANFTLHGGRTVRVPMMRNTRMYCSFSTSFLTRTTICALYFEGGRYAMIVFVPRGTGLVRLANDFNSMLNDRLEAHNLETVANAFMRYHKRSRRGDGGFLVDVSMPRFEISLDLNTKSHYEALRVTDIFQPNLSKLPGIRDSDPTGDNVYVSHTLQKVTVRIDESKAPPNPNAQIYPYKRAQSDCRIKTKRLNLNKAFFFTIVDYINNVSVISGIVYNPAHPVVVRPGQ